MFEADAPAECKLYPIRLMERLPVLPVPLRPHDPAVVLDLQPLVDTAYRNGRYWHTDYAAPLDPPLPAEAAAVLPGAAPG